MDSDPRLKVTAQNRVLARAIRLIREDPFACALALGLVGAGLVWGPGALRDYLRFPSAPLTTDVVGALRVAQGGKQWVSVSPGSWNRAQTFQRGVSCFVPATTADGNLLVAEIEIADRAPDVREEKPCDGVARGSLTGVIDTIPEHLVPVFTEQGLEAASGPTARLLHVPLKDGTNEKSDALLGVVLCFIAAPVLALGLFPIRRAVGRFHSTNRENLRVAAFAPDGAEANGTARRHGILLAALCALAFVVGEDWVLWGLVPVRAFAAVGSALGAFMIFAPNVFRRLHRRGWLGR